jgi:hypothetical protein
MPWPRGRLLSVVAAAIGLGVGDGNEIISLHDMATRYSKSPMCHTRTTFTARYMDEGRISRYRSSTLTLTLAHNPTLLAALPATAVATAATVVEVAGYWRRQSARQATSSPQTAGSATTQQGAAS